MLVPPQVIKLRARQLIPAKDECITNVANNRNHEVNADEAFFVLSLKDHSHDRKRARIRH
jgi:hypothetical protein